MCYKVPTKHDSVDDNAKDKNFFSNTNGFLLFSLLSGFVAASSVSCIIFLILYCKKMKIQQDEKFRTMYHRVNDTIGEDEDVEIVRVINKGL